MLRPISLLAAVLAFAIPALAQEPVAAEIDATPVNRATRPAVQPFKAPVAMPAPAPQPVPAEIDASPSRAAPAPVQAAATAAPAAPAKARATGKPVKPMEVKTQGAAAPKRAPASAERRAEAPRTAGKATAAK